MRLLVALFVLQFFTGLAFSQKYAPVNGIQDIPEGKYLLKNAWIKVAPDQPFRKGSLLVEDGKVATLSDSGIDEKGAVVIDLKGKYIFPSFIDLHSNYGLQVGELTKRTIGFQAVSDKAGAYSWNEALHPELDAADHFVPDANKAAEYRKAGFGSVLTHHMDGLSRGSGALVTLGEGSAHQEILEPRSGNHLSFSKGSSSQDNPTSLMGSIAVIRQLFYDGQWYAGHPEEADLSLEAWTGLQELPLFFDAGSIRNILRAMRIAEEFRRDIIVKGGGDEYQRIEGLLQSPGRIIVPLNFPLPMDVEDPLDAMKADLADLKHWELAPFNAALLYQEGISFSITSFDTRDRNKFLEELRIAIKKGLPEDAALRALTTLPAEWLGVSSQLGTLASGKIANFFIADTNILAAEGKILQNWVNGIPYEIEPLERPKVRGVFNLVLANRVFRVNLKYPGESRLLYNDSTEIKVLVDLPMEQVKINFLMPDQDPLSGFISLSGWESGDGFKGIGTLADGEVITWGMSRVEEEETESTDTGAKPEKKASEKELEPGPILYPFTAYGWIEKPKAQKVLFRNATVWTGEEDGILENTDVLISNGKILKIGKGLPEYGATVIDAEGKHLTSGIIDEHSHIGINGGVNEASEVSSADVRIGDVIDPSNINFYRQLAGGVTAAQLLHGSANPIGGQSAIVKFRWGLLPEEMKIKDAPGFIKFALGENVKRSNWGDGTRFPITRMGVEQVFEDYFTRARTYGSKTEKRRDLELDAILEVLRGERFVSCHAYVQSEINMLMKLAEKHGFRINTFTHILEGYKVADKMREHGAGASSFADWWAYKYEVIDAIPYNAKILHDQGVVVAINSDDAEMGRRINQEAAKLVKYGGMFEEDAWNTVTINPARLLHIDHRTGSIREGKDADLVLWSDNPLSIYAIAEQTYVDGVRYYDVDKDAELRQWIEKERARIIQKMIREKNKGSQVVRVEPRSEKIYHCDDID